MEILILIVCSIIIGLVSFYFGYMLGTEREYDRLCSKWMRGNLEDLK